MGPGPALRYPNLLKGRHIDRPNQAWCSDITYIRMGRGFAYLIAVMGWYSRYILSWTLFHTQNASVCVGTYKDALTISQPEIFHSDQGSQFASEEMTSPSKRAGIRISMCGRGRCYDNILIERLWRSVKYEEVYLDEYANLRQARQCLGGYISPYNHSGPHQIGYRTPFEVYHDHSGPHPAMAITHTRPPHAHWDQHVSPPPTTLAVFYLEALAKLPIAFGNSSDPSGMNWCNCPGLCE